MREPSFDQLQDQELALTVGCRYCGAGEGETCVTVGRDGRKHPLANFPAHLNRIERAKRLIRLNDHFGGTPVSADDALFTPDDILTPEWTRVPVTDLVVSLYRGQTVALGPDAHVRFTGTHRGADADGPYIVVHGTDSNGFTKQCTYRPGQTVSVRTAK